MTAEQETVPDCATRSRKAYLVGSGIASLSAAAFLIRDGAISGKDIIVLESGDRSGGALDGTGSPETGYVIRGGRMFEDEAFRCTHELMSLIPSLTDPTKTIRDEMREFNEKVPPIYKGQYDIRVMFNTFKTMMS